MKESIQFEKIDVKKSRTNKVLVVFAYLLLAVLTCVSILSVRAYFTATASRSGQISFGSIEVKLLESDESEITKAEFTTKYLNNITPGSTISFNDITVKNTGTSDAYVLLNLDIKILSSDKTDNDKYDLHYNLWYNVAGQQVSAYEFVLNTTKPTKVEPNNSETTSISWKVPGEVVDNKYKTSRMTVNLSAYACQTYMPSAGAYEDGDLYASYFIVSKANEIASTTGSTYSGLVPYSDPARKVGAISDNYDSTTQTLTRNINKIELTGNETWSAYKGYPTTEVEGVSYRLTLTDNKIGFQTSYCSHFKNVDEAWKEGHKNDMGVYSDHNSYRYIYFRAPNANIKALESASDNFESALAGFKTWLAEKYANGQPVTLWYQDESPTTSTIYSDKNLYSGAQSFKYKTGGAENTINSVGEFSITKKDSSVSGAGIVLDENLFDYLKDKSFTISYQIKRYEDDEAGNAARLGVGFYGTTANYINGMYIDCQSTVEQWEHCWITVPALSDLSLSSECVQIRFWLARSYYADNSYTPHRNFEIKNIQIELGEVPTEFN